MAFSASTVKYTSSFESADGGTYQWEIRQRDYAGGSTSLTPSSRGHCSLRWISEGDDEFGPFYASELSLSFFDTAGDDVMSELFSNEGALHKEYTLAITQGGSLLWIGFLEPVSAAIGEDGPTMITISATCGLGRLKDSEYSDAVSSGNPKTGRDRLTTIIAEMLSATGFGLDIYMATDMYPRKASSQLTQDNNPLHNIYVDRMAFSVGREGGSSDDATPANRGESLRAICSRFGLIVFQAEGAWHVYSEELFYSATSFYRWKYDSAGSESGGAEPLNRDLFTHSVSPSNEQIERHRAYIGQLPQYNAVTVKYWHDVATPLLNSDFSPLKESRGRIRGRTQDEYWQTDNSGVNSRRVSQFNQEDEYEWKIDRVTHDWVGDTAASINTAIGDYGAAQTTLSSYPSGTQFRFMMETYLDSVYGRGARGYNPDVAIALQIKLNSSPTEYYLELDTSTSDDAKLGTWTTTADTWMLLEGSPADLDTFKSQWFDLDSLPDDGTLTVTIGPPLEQQEYTDSGGAISNIDFVLWDNVRMSVIRADGELNPVSTVVTNYLESADRDDYRGKTVETVIGDGPQDDSRGSMTTSADIADRTADWEEGPITGAASGDSIDDLLTRMILRSTNRPRRTHETTYEYLGQRLSPLYTIRRSGSNYKAREVQYDFIRATADGNWYRTQQTGFTDNLEFGIDSGAGSAALLRGTGDIAGIFAKGLSTSFFSENSRRITRTTAVIPSGSSTSSISVEEISDSLLQSGDLITIIAPDLSFHQVQVNADQASGDTSITITDPDNPGTNYDFPVEIAYPANVFFAEDKLLSVARLGEQGFAVTVLGEYIGTIDETKSGTYTALNVTSWIASLKSGDTCELQQADGSYTTVELTADAPRGTTTISFLSTSIDVESGDAVKPSGSVSRADFTVTADAITAYIGSPGGVIATLSSDSTWDGTNTSLPVSGLTDDLKEGDPILIYTPAGSVIKATVNADILSGATPIVLTAADGDQTSSITSGSKVVPGSLTGLRIDMDNIEFTADTVNSSNYSAGSTGWALQNDGSAEFNNVNVRGAITLQAGSDADWSYVSGSGKPDDNATAGATWGVNITSQPTDAALLNAQQIWNDISGTGKPADNATVGATWGTDLLGKPEGADNLTSDASPSTGLNLTNTYLGYYNGSAWTTYMDGSGNFYLGGVAGKLQWNGSTLYINGNVRAQTGYIGNGVSGFTINSTYFANGKTSISDVNAGVYVGTDGIALGASSTFKVTSAGALTATSATISGEITATSGAIDGTLTMGASGLINFTGGGSLAPRSLQAGTNTLSLGGQAINIGSGLIVANEDNGTVAIAGTSTGSVSLGSTSAATTISTTTSGDININSAGDVLITATGDAKYGGVEIVTGTAASDQTVPTQDTVITFTVGGVQYLVAAEAV